MLAYAFRRGYLGLIGVLLFTMPLFALLRDQMYYDPCSVVVDCSRMIFLDAPKHRGWSELVWQRGFSPYDYRPLAFALVTAVAAFEAIAIFRARHRIA